MLEDSLLTWVACHEQFVPEEDSELLFDNNLSTTCQFYMHMHVHVSLWQPFMSIPSHISLAASYIVFYSSRLSYKLMCGMVPTILPIPDKLLPLPIATSMNHYMSTARLSCILVQELSNYKWITYLMQSASWRCTLLGGVVSERLLRQRRHVHNHHDCLRVQPSH